MGDGSQVGDGSLHLKKIPRHQLTVATEKLVTWTTVNNNVMFSHSEQTRMS